MPECQCQSDTLRINVNDGVGASDSYFPSPTALERGQVPCAARAGDPINVANGNMFLSRTDVSFGTDLGLPIEFTRLYNSYTDDTSSALDHGWRHGYHYALANDTNAADYVLYEPDGRILTLNRHDTDCRERHGDRL